MAEYFYYTQPLGNNIYNNVDYLNKIKVNAILNKVKNNISIYDYYRKIANDQLLTFGNMGKNIFTDEMPTVQICTPSTSISDYYTPNEGEQVIAITSCNKMKSTNTPDFTSYALYYLQQEGYELITANKVKKNDTEYTVSISFHESGATSSDINAIITVNVSDGTTRTHIPYRIAVDVNGVETNNTAHNTDGYTYKLIYYKYNNEYKVKAIKDSTSYPSYTIDTDSNLKTYPMPIIKHTFFYADEYDDTSTRRVNQHNSVVVTDSAVTQTRYDNNKILLKCLDTSIDDIIDNIRDSDTDNSIVDSLFVVGACPYMTKATDTATNNIIKSDETYLANATILFHLFYTICNGLFIGSGADFYNSLKGSNVSGYGIRSEPYYQYNVIFNNIAISTQWQYATYNIYEGIVTTDNCLEFTDYPYWYTWNSGTGDGGGVSQNIFKSLYVRTQITDTLYAEIGLMAFSYTAQTATTRSRGEDASIWYGNYFKQLYDDGSDGTGTKYYFRSLLRGSMYDVEYITLNDKSKYALIIPLLQDSMNGLTILEKMSITANCYQLLSFGFDEVRRSWWDSHGAIVTILAGVILSVATFGIAEIISGPITVLSLSGASAYTAVAMIALTSGIIGIAGDNDGSIGGKIVALVANIVLGALTFGIDITINFTNICKLALTSLHIADIFVSGSTEVVESKTETLFDKYQKEIKKQEQSIGELQSVGITANNIFNTIQLGRNISVDTLYNIAYNYAYDYDQLYNIDLWRPYEIYTKTNI